MANRNSECESETAGFATLGKCLRDQKRTKTTIKSRRVETLHLLIRSLVSPFAAKIFVSSVESLTCVVTDHSDLFSSILVLVSYIDGSVTVVRMRQILAFDSLRTMTFND